VMGEAPWTRLHVAKLLVASACSGRQRLRRIGVAAGEARPRRHCWVVGGLATRARGTGGGVLGQRGRRGSGSALYRRWWRA
jgi:hypothetical protein